eukprot:6984026-Lingulodinium_polyedra.AAC.1
MDNGEGEVRKRCDQPDQQPAWVGMQDHKLFVRDARGLVAVNEGALHVDPEGAPVLPLFGRWGDYGPAI